MRRSGTRRSGGSTLSGRTKAEGARSAAVKDLQHFDGDRSGLLEGRRGIILIFAGSWKNVQYCFIVRETAEC